MLKVANKSFKGRRSALRFAPGGRSLNSNVRRQMTRAYVGRRWEGTDGRDDGGGSGPVEDRDVLKYVAEVEGFGDMFQEHDPDPRNKKKCKSLMVQDPETGEWVLRYHLHT